MEKERVINILETIASKTKGAANSRLNLKEANALDEYVAAMEIAVEALKEDIEEENRKATDFSSISDYEHMLMSALRYAIGRRTYIVSLTTKYITNEIPKLSHKCRHVMLRDIENAQNYGDNCDETEWMKLRRELLSSLELDRRVSEIERKNIVAMYSNVFPNLYFSTHKEAVNFVEKCNKAFLNEDVLFASFEEITLPLVEADSHLRKTEEILKILVRKGEE